VKEDLVKQKEYLVENLTYFKPEPSVGSGKGGDTIEAHGQD